MVAKFYFILTWLQRMGKQSAKLVAAALSPAASPLTCPSILILYSEFRVNINFLLAAPSRNGIINLFAVQKGKLRMNPHLEFRAALFRFFAHTPALVLRLFSRWHEKLMKTFIFHLLLFLFVEKKGFEGIFQ